jgi:hypothetical protein
MATRTAESPLFGQDPTLEPDGPADDEVRSFERIDAPSVAEPDTSADWTDDPDINVNGSER